MPFDVTTLLAYSAACILLIIAPGPGQALIIARTLAGDTRDGVLTALGLQIGTLVHTIAAALGLSAILATSATAFSVVKYAGAAYLIFLGVMALRRVSVRGDAASRSSFRERRESRSLRLQLGDAPRALTSWSPVRRMRRTPGGSDADVLSATVSKRAPGSDARRANDRRLLAHATITGILNPKVALFFLAFLPQFVHPERGMVLVQFLALGLILAFLGVIGDSAVAYAAGHARERFLTNTRFMAWREGIMGSMFIVLGVRLAFIARN